ncbi:MAG: vWA domain-containing protein [Bacteroidota bacterium]
MMRLQSNKALLLALVLISIPMYSFQSTPTHRHVMAHPASVQTVAPSAAKKIKIALLLDTSGSMDGLIDQAKAQLWTIVEELAKAKCDWAASRGAKPEVTIALYEYGNDRLSAKEGYIRMVTPLTHDLDKLSADLFSLTIDGGSEFCGHVIQTACRQLDWSTDGDDFQVIFIAGNEPFTQGNVNYKEACALARSKHIVVNTIFCGPMEEGISTSWKAGADLTGGNYMSIEQNRKTVFIPSPYDAKITELNIQLNTTYIEYGKGGKEKKMNQSTQDNNAQSYGAGNAVKRAVSKSSHIYKNDSWDLVDKSEEKGFEVSKIDKEELPEPMKNMSDDQKKQFITKKKAERDQIKSEIGQLNQQREKYIAQQNKQSTDDKMLDKVMLQSIRKQAATKKLTF